MRRPDIIPDQPGVFAILNRREKYAYVQEARSLKERAAIWASVFRRHELTGEPLRVRAWPENAKGEWEFTFDFAPGYSVEDVQAALLAEGWKVIPSRRRSTRLHVIDGIRATLLEHCERRGVPNWAAVYKRVQRGERPHLALKAVEKINNAKE